MKNLVFRIRKQYFDAIVKGQKTVEYRRDSKFWRSRIFNLLDGNMMRSVVNENIVFRVSQLVIGVFVCGKRVHRRQIISIEKIETPDTFSEQGKKDVETPYCFAFHLGSEVS